MSEQPFVEMQKVKLSERDPSALIEIKFKDRAWGELSHLLIKDIKDPEVEEIKLAQQASEMIAEYLELILPIHLFTLYSFDEVEQLYLAELISEFNKRDTVQEQVYFLDSKLKAKIAPNKFWAELEKQLVQIVTNNIINDLQS